MERHADGEEGAFGVVYDLLAPRLLAYFLRRTRDRAHSEDLTQQTLLHMHRARQTFVRGSEVTPWAFAIARRVLIDGYRRSRQEGRFGSLSLEDVDSDGWFTGEGGPDEVASANQLARVARAELDRLPDTQRAAFLLVRQEGLSMAEAAEVLGTTPVGVKQRVFRVYRSLRAALGLGATSEREEGE